MLSKLANGAVDPLVTLMYRLRRNPRLRKFIIDARNRNIFVTLDQHERMLSDQLRVDTYYRAISKQVKKGDVVADLGTGTGILSFFAAAQDPRKDLCDRSLQHHRDGEDRRPAQRYQIDRISQNKQSGILHQPRRSMY